MFTSEITNREGKIVARVVFSDKSGGYSQDRFAGLNLANHVGDAPIAVGYNRAIFAERLGLPVAKLTWPELIHSADVGVVDADIETFPNVDALISTKRKRGLVTMGADCAMLLMVDPENKVIGSSHIGWQGAAADALGNFYSAFESLGGKMKSSHLFLGPSICANCYKVSEDRIAAVAKYLPDAVVGDGIDIRLGIAAVAKAKGLKVQVVGGCTSCDSNYYSYRRDGVTGRQGGAVVLL
ncbi:MAG: hypothetical protein RL038_111 [Actinomycetota bacterium]|jgi:YfiH family protein